MTETLAELLRSFRSGARLSQEALAERAGLSTRTVSDIETGFARSPRLVTLMLLAEALELSEHDRARLQAAGRKPAPAAAVAAASPTLQPVALVGRDAEVAEISALLARDDVRLVTLLGPAGVGKTSLATRIAFERANAFEHGAALVELAPISDPRLVPAAVAGALGIRESAASSAGDALLAHLRARHMLLVLDNLEHLTPAAPWIRTLVGNSPRIVVLSTSREALHLRAEHVYAVRPLQHASAVQLFVQRGKAVKPDFELTPANREAVGTIIDRLEGLPLAIELAAPRLSLLPPKALAARLERRLPLLGDGAVDLPERQQTMHAAIAWSYDLLAAEEQHLFRLLSVLQGGGSLEAAAAVAGEANRSILFRLAPLVERSLLSLVEDADGEPRVVMLEMLREYGHERLGDSDELDEAQRRHAEYVLQFAQRAENELTGPHQGRWLSRLEREHANLRAALQWALQEEEVLLALRLVGAIWRFWWVHGYLSEGLSWLRRVLDLARSSTTPIPDALYAKALRALVVLLSAFGNFDEALTPCEDAIRLQRNAGDDAGLSASLTSLGIILQFRGDLDGAERVQAEALEIRRRLRDERGIATSLSNLAAIAWTKDDMERAATLANESASIYRRLGHESGLAHALMKLGLVAARRREYDSAEALFEECLRLQQSVAGSGSMYYSLLNLASVAHRKGNDELALARYHEALSFLDSIPNRAALAKALEEVAVVIAALGDPARGARILGAADTLRRTIGSPLFPSERADYDADVATVREMLGDAIFQAQWQIGANATPERALEEAREEGAGVTPAAAAAEPSVRRLPETAVAQQVGHSPR